MGSITPAVRFLLISTCIIFFLQELNQRAGGTLLTLSLSLSMDGMKKMQLWQPLTYMFVHGGFWHLLLNMLGLFFFGPDTERELGTKHFILLYLTCGILGGLGWLLFNGAHGGYCLGASGAIFGVLGAFAALFPERRITLLIFFILPVTLKARTMAIGLGILTVVSMISMPGYIAYTAHLLGGLAGYGYIIFVLKHKRPGANFNLRRWLNNILWHWQRRKFKVISSPPSARDAENDFTPEDVDRILDKIAREGIHSLTQAEREIMEKASRKHR